MCISSQRSRSSKALTLLLCLAIVLASRLVTPAGATPLTTTVSGVRKAPGGGGGGGHGGPPGVEKQGQSGQGGGGGGGG